MNPLGLLVLALGVVIIIVGVKGSQHNLVAALTNKHQPGQTTGTVTRQVTYTTPPPTGAVVQPNLQAASVPPVNLQAAP